MKAVKAIGMLACGLIIAATLQVCGETNGHISAAITRTFINEVNGQKPKPMYTATGGREYHGQRID